MGQTSAQRQNGSGTRLKRYCIAWQCVGLFLDAYYALERYLHHRPCCRRCHDPTERACMVGTGNCYRCNLLATQLLRLNAAANAFLPVLLALWTVLRA